MFLFFMPKHKYIFPLRRDNHSVILRLLIGRHAKTHYLTFRGAVEEELKHKSSHEGESLRLLWKRDMCVFYVKFELHWTSRLVTEGP